MNYYQLSYNLKQINRKYKCDIIASWLHRYFIQSMNRLESLSQQMIATTAPKSPNDVVICAAVRTPLTKAKRGGLKDTQPDTLMKAVFTGVIERSKVDPKKIQDICVGNNLMVGAGEIHFRMAQLMSGIPDSTSIMAVNRLCSSGLEACGTIAAKIKAGIIDCGIGAGIQCMSLYDMNSSVNTERLSDSIFEHEEARKCLIGMGETSENVAEKYGITREKQDKMAVESHQKAYKAQKAGLFKQEIVPIKTTILDKDGNAKQATITEDDGIRVETTVEGLGKLKPAFKKTGTTTAGNSSQVTDGAAAVLLARRSFAEKNGLPILARFTDYQVAGCPPDIMGIGPAVVIPVLLERNKLNVGDIDIYEINEAFASQATYCVDKLKIDGAKLNPKGGAIALGHPLGCTGSRQIATLLPEMKRTGAKRGVVSMCIGTGMGAAALIQKE